MLLTAHLDLKGVQRRHEEYPAYLDQLSALGYRALLVEYEDCFPFEDRCFSRHPEEKWSRAFAEEFQNEAWKRGIEIIPLQQCLSHLEYAFRLPKYQRYCLPHASPRDLHIGKAEARDWMKAQLIQIITAHPRSRFIHIGMDEARPLEDYAKANGLEVLPLFLDYLEELCTVCETYGKTPLIWSDMLEDHIAPECLERLCALKDRVILVPWDYFANDRQPNVVARFSGFRCSERWFSTPQDAPVHTPPSQGKLSSLESLPPPLRKLLDGLFQTPWSLEPLFQVSVWKRLGFRVWGAASGVVTQDRSLLPYYQRRFANLDTWHRVAETHGLEGLIVTQWARSNSLTTPNALPCTAWPVLAKAGAPHDLPGNLSKCFPGIPGATLERIVFLMGNCREGWMIDEQVISEMETLTPLRHQDEWRTLVLMLRLFSLQKAFESVEENIRCYFGLGRLSAAAWQSQNAALQSVQERLEAMEPEVRRHLDRKYFGHALEEWFFRIFDLPKQRIARLRADIATSGSPQER